jgi:hypothetical protein
MKNRVFKKNQSVSLLALAVSVMVLGVMVTRSRALGSPTMSIKKVVGSDFGTRIEGKFRISGEGTSDVVKMELLFNNKVVYSVESNTLSFTFETKNYPEGETNITLIAYDASGNSAQTSKNYTFMSPTDTQYITIPIIALVVVAVIFKYGRRWKKNKDQDTPKSKNSKPEVEISIDKDFK